VFKVLATLALKRPVRQRGLGDRHRLQRLRLGVERSNPAGMWSFVFFNKRIIIGLDPVSGAESTGFETKTFAEKPHRKS
jgi:hypothetical protein